MLFRNFIKIKIWNKGISGYAVQFLSLFASCAIYSDLSEAGGKIGIKVFLAIAKLQMIDKWDL